MRRVLLAALLLPACGASGRAQFTGREAATLVDADAVELHREKEVPSGHVVLGVVTTNCQTYDGASGLTEAPCTEDALLSAAREKASSVGGTMLVEPACESRVLERTIERLQGGGAKGHVRMRLQCRASVVRPANGSVAANVTPHAVDHADKAPRSERITLGGSAVQFAFEPVEPRAARKPRAPDDVTEVERIPEGGTSLGNVWAECEASCSSGTARRGLKEAAARAGAFAIAAVTCEPVSERWRCEGQAVTLRGD